MKTIEHLSLVLLIFLLISYNQVRGQNSNFAFFYNLDFIKDTTDLESRQKELMVLWSGPEMSMFQSYNGYLRDSVLNHYLNIAKDNDNNKRPAGSTDINKMLQEMNQFPVPLFSYKVVKHKNKGEINNFRKIFRTDYMYQESMGGITWTIEKEAKEILGYQCNLATCTYGGRKFMAWFAPELPLDDGPYIFQGLPGLIFELYDSECNFHFTLIGLERKSINIENYLPDNYLKVNKLKFFSIEDEYKKNVFSQMSEADAQRVSPSDALRVQERVKSENNRLELIIDN
ncbi:GLPGLI family protein [Cecembia calidifontis]|jgi:GLPGLI family protein|uniref:GLPGLI family protein n=1 Tax=Cecembia calidifontis TaxID=1187080 RepID=A0A4Q7P3L8_9BACT|nr:GLPGLI family protein [Cecembia calidifontis]RZS94536.1 GLPGLI family protein [Cecembia calidifontis]